MSEDRGTYLPLTWNRDTGELGVHLPEEKAKTWEDFFESGAAEELAREVWDEADKQPPKLAHPTYLVETTVTYRMRYVVACKNEEHAMDTVVMEEAKEFSQEYLGEQIISARPIKHDEIIALCDKDNDYCKDWDIETKYRNFVTEVDYSK
jgi:hypothetical protein